MMIDLVIFDCDGVLVDSEAISSEVLIDVLSHIGIELTPEFVRQNCLGRSFPTVAASIRARADRALPDDFEERYRRRLFKRYETDLKVTPGLKSVLSRLVVPCCVATSSSPPRVGRTLHMTGLSSFFGDRVFTASQVARGKPAPDLFLLAAERMVADPARTLVIEDSGPGLAAGFAAGMQVALYAGGSHLIGADLTDWEDIDILGSWADFPPELLSSYPTGTIQ
ncbi:HAD family hydrolase [Roseisalinus antarcticus]|uniref:6-phosphogluconate phosphatase n=1 Tax=Roseisalinus antarcticus TaxID=254357 RepID=A0A1Y5TKU9_9RHOB|nr:HAD family hydrolase [Roseisalinus antarcticus]SLN65931.1 6-phosphogluconate phosphatase [Roseisalinus antarcticus]